MSKENTALETLKGIESRLKSETGPATIDDLLNIVQALIKQAEDMGANPIYVQKQNGTLEAIPSPYQSISARARELSESEAYREHLRLFPIEPIRYGDVDAEAMDREEGGVKSDLPPCDDIRHLLTPPSKFSDAGGEAMMRSAE